MMNIPTIKCGVLQGEPGPLIFFEIRKVVINNRTINNPVIKWRGYSNTRP
jgi:hypothetical protein